MKIGYEVFQIMVMAMIIPCVMGLLLISPIIFFLVGLDEIIRKISQKRLI